MSQPTVKCRRDNAGIVVASLCFLHCVAGPALLAFGGLASLISISERFESLFLLASAAMGAFALFPAYRRSHGRLSCLAMFGSGILVMLIRRHLTGSLAEPACALVGASLIIGAHALNIHYSRRCECCTPTLDVHTQIATAEESAPELASGPDKDRVGE